MKLVEQKWQTQNRLAKGLRANRQMGCSTREIPRHCHSMISSGHGNLQVWKVQSLCRRFLVAEQRRPTLLTFPGSTVSLIVQFEAWKVQNLDKELEGRLSALSGIWRSIWDQNDENSQECLWWLSIITTVLDVLMEIRNNLISSNTACKSNWWVWSILTGS